MASSFDPESIFNLDDAIASAKPGAKRKPKPSDDPESVFNLDAAATAPTVEAAKLIEPELVPAAEVFSLDAEPAIPVSEEEVLVLGDDAIVPDSELAAKPSGPKPAPVRAAEIFSLDAEAVTAQEEFAPVEEVIPIEAEVVDEPPPLVEAIKPAAAVVAKASARPPFGSGSSTAMAALADTNGSAKQDARKRPAVKITLVKPGEKSPFAK